ncbi:hypothetical protein NQ314_009118 [Rhamnusium bicolor]|uniref:Rho-GAP domain-containing protein n=1 Tax=Rhamnusium bicolor TaxID=1586634 RepID=A0AAV8Y2H8_9CUCU|nr:hypothetical protein NQ314_009118 [Rhamnusium bicolor]
MESEEALRYYLDEVKDTQNDINIEEEVHIPNEAEQATEFLHKAGLSDLTKLYQQGREITENVVNDSVRQRNLTEKQAQTIRSRVRTLNKTLRSRQPRRKQRQDIRDVSWNVETSSTGTRSRSATPDSLDSGEVLNDDLTSDEDQQLTSLPPFSDHGQIGFKTKIKWTTSEPLQNKKFNRTDKADVAHLGSENVILKGYQALTENGTLPRPPQRERSGSDPTTEVHLQPLKSHNTTKTTNLHNQLSRSHNNITINTNNNCSKIYIHSNDTNEIDAVSFEGLLKKNDSNQLNSVNIEKWDSEEGISIDELSDSEYQYLKPLLYVELVAIFDQYKISYLKRKASSKNKGGNVFGVNLSTLVMRDMPRPTDNSMVPEIFQSILNQLNTRCITEDGILRIAGQKQKLEILCNEIETKFFNSRRDIENLLTQATVHELTAIPHTEDKVKALNLLVLMLPIEHRNTYRLLLEFFLNITSHEKQNRMNLHNVAMITAPSFFPPRLLLPKDNDKLIMKQLTKEELAKRINGAAVCCCIMETMLMAGKKLWTVPNYLAHQAREAQKRAQVRKDLSKDKDKRIVRYIIETILCGFGGVGSRANVRFNISSSFSIRSGKTKLVRSSTQYEPGAMNAPRLKRDFYI